MAKASKPKTKKEQPVNDDFVAEQTNPSAPFEKTEEESVVGEDVSPEETGESHELQVERAGNREIAKLDINKAKIAALKEQYSTLSIAGIDDKKGLKAVEEAKRTVRKMRTTLEAKRKMLKSDYLTIGRMIDDAARSYNELIIELEQPLDAMLEQHEELLEQEAKMKEEEANRQLNERVDALLSSGIAFNGAYYTIGSIFVDITTLRTLSDADFVLLINKVQQEKQRIDDEIAEKMEAERLENERLENEKKEMEAEQQRLKEEKDRMEAERKKMEEEKEAMRREMLQMREQQAFNAGLSFNPNTLCYEFSNKYLTESIGKEFMSTASASEFSEAIKEAAFKIKTAIGNAQVAERKQQQHDAEMSGRKMSLMNLGMKISGEGLRFSDSEIFISNDEIQEHNTESWTKQEAKYESLIKAHIAEVDRKKHEEERMKEERMKRYDERCNVLIGYGMQLRGNTMTFSDEYGIHLSIDCKEIFTSSDEQWNAETIRIAEDIEDKKEESLHKRHHEEEMRIAAIPEVDKLRSFIGDIAAIQKPALNNADLFAIATNFHSKVTEAVLEYTNELNKYTERYEL